MTDNTIRLSDLPLASALADGDLLPLLQAGGGARVTIAQVKALIAASVSGFPWASVPAGTTVSVDAGRQMMVFNSLTLDGSLVVDGNVGVWN